MNLSDLTEEETQALEELSDNIRKGIPVGIHEAILVIEYQDALKVQKKSEKWYRRFFNRM